MSFGTRLMLVSLVTLAVGLGATLTIGNVLLNARVDAEHDARLRERAQAEIAALAVTEHGITVRETQNDALLDRDSWVLQGGRVLERPARVTAALDRRAVALGRTGRRAQVQGPGGVRLRAEPLRAPGSARTVGAVVVGVETEPLEGLQHAVALGSLVLALAVLLAGWLAIRAALQGALRPVATMTARADSWSAHDLDGRFDLGPPSDELTGLAATLDRLLARIGASRRHEQRFAGDVAHELRTPLAAIRARAELALAADDEREPALRDILRRAEELGVTIDTLLAVARGEVDPAGSSVDVRALAEGFDGVTVTGPPDLPRAEGDADVVLRALSPLVDNARRHARERVTVELSADERAVRIAVRDDGPGLDPALGERAFEPGMRGAGAGGDGAGLGLPLARRLARTCGGDVVAGPGPGGCFVLVLPTA